VKSYKVILLPIFGVSRMVRGRRLCLVMKRGMLNWSHYKFRQRLLQKAELTLMYHEPYSSKTCGECGHCHKNLGGRKTCKCPKPDCHYRADRNASAARNIFMCWCTLKNIEP